MSVDLVGPGPRPALLDSHWVPASAPCQRKNGESGAAGEPDAHPSAPTDRARPDPRQPELGAVPVTPPEHDPLRVTELIEHEQGMVAGAAEVAVEGRALLVAVGLADRAVHVENDPGELA